MLFLIVTSAPGKVSFALAMSGYADSKRAIQRVDGHRTPLGEDGAGMINAANITGFAVASAPSIRRDACHRAHAATPSPRP
jgi:hypothetical protein